MKNSVLARLVTTRARLVAVISAAALLSVALFAQADQMVPFKGKCYGKVLDNGSHWNDPGYVIADVGGTGTLVGEFTGTLTREAPITDENGDVIALKLSLVLIAANGDKLEGDVTQTETGGIVVIMGGTGRFDGASGGWVSTITGPGPTPGSWTESFIGEISTVGSNKR